MWELLGEAAADEDGVCGPRAGVQQVRPSLQD